MNLFHFCAKHNLPKMAEFLCTKYGRNEIMLVKDENGLTPMDIATANGNIKMMEIFSRFGFVLLFFHVFFLI